MFGLNPTNMTHHFCLPQLAAAPSPSELVAYLRQQGWALVSVDADWAVCKQSLEGEEVVLEVPQQAAARDYARAVSVLLDDIARLERRSATNVLRDVKATSVDVVRIAIDGSSTRDGRIAVEAGRRVYEAARDLLLSAACSVIDPRPVFAKRKPEEAMKLLNTARFGQTEVGSFVLTIECSVAPRLQQPLLDDGDDIDAPFERKTCVRLAHATVAAEAATRESAATGSIEPFQRGDKHGVSANLCDAIAEMLDSTNAEALTLGFSFASRRPLVRPVPRLVAFSSDTSAVLREAAARLRDESSYPATEVVGTVVRLDSPNSAVGGDAILRAQWEGRMRPVKVTLDAEGYVRAIQAHGDRALVRVIGDLAREGRSWCLRNPRDFATVLEVDEG
jgi:hypothetical protein